jgi:hypothetical protein
VIATSLSDEALDFPQQPALFHVEHGRVSAQAQKVSRSV